MGAGRLPGRLPSSSRKVGGGGGGLPTNMLVAAAAGLLAYTVRRRPPPPPVAGGDTPASLCVDHAHPTAASVSVAPAHPNLSYRNHYSSLSKHRPAPPRPCSHSPSTSRSLYSASLPAAAHLPVGVLVGQADRLHGRAEGGAGVHPDGHRPPPPRCRREIDQHGGGGGEQRGMSG